MLTPHPVLELNGQIVTFAGGHCVISSVTLHPLPHVRRLAEGVNNYSLHPVIRQAHPHGNRWVEVPADGTIVLVDVSGQYEFAEFRIAADQHASVETESGRVLGGRLEEEGGELKLHCPGGPVKLERAGTFVPGYARAVEHFIRDEE